MTPPAPPEVRPYLIRLVLLILCSIVLMTSVATWAWKTYGKRLEDRPALPQGTPAFRSVPSHPGLPPPER